MALLVRCGPCKTLAPILEGLERKHTSTIFAKVDVDQAQDCAKQYNVTSMPTILFFKNRSEVGRVVGADVGKIQTLIKTHEGGSSFSGAGQTLGSGGGVGGGENGASSTIHSVSGSFASPASSGLKRNRLDDAPYHMRLWTAFGHLSSGILHFCTRCLQSLTLLAGSAKTGLIGHGSSSKEVKTVEGPGGSCQIQVRMLDGTSIRGEFAPEHTVQRVQEFVQANMDARGIKAPGFKLITNFPKTVYKDDSLHQTLEEAKLTPRAQLIVMA
ncbi:hypothetical protein EDD11_006049 [Mortierella claussenii]|nr:hypothetical protein EDD11_006049 [Mortierella claussenii]